MPRRSARFFKCKLKFNLQAVGFPTLNEAPAPRTRDLPDPIHERPSYMSLKRRARQLLQQAARLADASTLGDDDRAEMARLRGEAERVLQDLESQFERAETPNNLGPALEELGGCSEACSEQAAARLRC